MSAEGSLGEWIAKADEDYHVALGIMRFKKNPSFDSACFHCQQCAEKYLKGFLSRHQVDFRKTHDLRDLNRQCVEIDAAFELIAGQLVLLKNYAIKFRYPGASATQQEAKEAVAAMKTVRNFVRARLALR